MPNPFCEFKGEFGTITNCPPHKIRAWVAWLKTPEGKIWRENALHAKREYDYNMQELRRRK